MGLSNSQQQPQQIEEQRNEKEQDNQIEEHIFEEKQDEFDNQIVDTLREEEKQEALKNQEKIKMMNSMNYELFYGKNNIKPLKQYYYLVKPEMSFESFVDKHTNENGFYLLSRQEQKEVRVEKIILIQNELRKMLGIKDEKEEEEIPIQIQTHESKRLEMIAKEEQKNYELFYGKGKCNV